LIRTYLDTILVIGTMEPKRCRGRYAILGWPTGP